MLKNYLKIALRNMLKNKAFSFINIFGLAVGMACTILILIWVQDELSFDRFHKNAENIYLVVREENKENLAVTSKLLAPALREELSEVKKSTSYMPFPESFSSVVQYGNNAFDERIAVADSNFFDIFSFPCKEGNSTTALRDPVSMVITEEAAKKYFGNDNAIGKTLSISAFGRHLMMRVSAVLENFPENSHIQSNLIFPITLLNSLGIKDYGWQNNSYHTYIMLNTALKTATDFQELSSRILACTLRHDPNQPKSLNYSLLPFTKIHLFGSNIRFLSTTGDIKYVRIFIAVAFIILLIAVLNYVNLSMALSMKRTGEVGIRKAIGGSRLNLIFQFFGESFILTFIALGFALLLAELFLPEFNILSGKKLAIQFNESSVIGIIVIVALFTSIISGCYPALFLSSFSPAKMLKGKLNLNPKGFIIRKGLVVFQFALSIIIIASTLVVFNQLSFIRKSHLGFDKENILCVHISGEANNRYDIFRNEIQRNPDIIAISRSEPLNKSALGNTHGVSWPGKINNEESHFWLLHSDCDLASVYKFKMWKGRYYSDQFPSDEKDAIVVNESAVKAMNLKSPLNEKIQVWGRTGNIIGVVKDFHFDSFHSSIEPLIFRIPDKNEQNSRYVTVSIRFKAGTLENTLAYVKKVWEEKMQNIPMKYYFFDEALNEQYSSENRLSSVFKYFSFISILLACLGLFGLASLSAQRRTKEIGVRKVLGATIWNISFILSKEFMSWVIFSNVIALPAAYYFMYSWLQDFVYKVDLTFWPFLIAGISTIIIALLTLSGQVIKSATANPVDALKYE